MYVFPPLVGVIYLDCTLDSTECESEREQQKLQHLDDLFAFCLDNYCIVLFHIHKHHLITSGISQFVSSMLLFMNVGLSVILFINPAAESFSVKVLQGQIVGRLGSTVTLPCWISPPLNAEHLEIRFDAPVLFYGDGRMQEVQEEQYRKRSSLTRRSSQSEGLRDGDVSLRLENLTVYDEGSFHCYVSGDRSQESQTITLNIAALGSAPLLFLKSVGDAHVNISCRSSGWFPEPSVLWMSDRRTLLSAGGHSHSRGSDGTFSIHSWTLVSLSDTPHVFCVLSLSSGEEREGGMDIQATVTSSCSEGPWKTLFITFVIFALFCLFGVIAYKHKDKFAGKKTSEDNPANKTSEHITKLRENAVVITLDRDSAHPDLKISHDLKVTRDSPGYQQRGDGVFPYELCVCGAQTFTSGRHYWEVQLVNNNNVEPKCFWLIGVVKVGNYRLTDKASLTPSNGFWFLCSDGPKGFYTNTEPPLTLSVSPRPQCVGVLLDYDGGQLSFYDVTEGKHILTISTGFSGPVAPLFNPGVGDRSLLRIIDVPVPEESPAEPCDPLLQNSQSSV